MNKRQRAADILLEACKIAYLEADMYLQNEDLGAEDASFMFENIRNHTKRALKAAGREIHE